MSSLSNRSPRKRSRGKGKGMGKGKGKEGQRDLSPMGYPLAEQTFSLYPQLMTYEEYMTSSAKVFSCWLPVYLNEDYYVSGRDILEDTLLHLSNLLKNKNTKRYTPFAALRVFPKILNRLGMEMMMNFESGNGVSSDVMVQAYSNIVRLFTRILDEGEGEMWGELEGRIERFLEQPWGCGIPIGEMAVLVAMSKRWSFLEDGDVKSCVLDEYFIRKVGEVERFMRAQPLLQTKSDERTKEEGERKLRRELRGRITQEMRREETNKLSSAYTFTISNYEAWKRSISSPSSPSIPFTVTTTKSSPCGLEWAVSCSKREAYLKLVRGWETWGVDWELTVRLYVGSVVRGREEVVVLNGKNKVINVTRDLVRALEEQKKGARGEGVEFVVEGMVKKVTSAIHEDRRGRDVERVYRKELPEVLKKWREDRKEGERNVRKVESLEGQLEVHFGATEVANKALVFGVVAPRWFLVEGAKEMLDENMGRVPSKVMEGVVGLVEMIRGMKGYGEFFKALKFEVNGGNEGMGRYVRKAEMALEGEVNLDSHLFVWRRGERNEGQR